MLVFALLLTLIIVLLLLKRMCSIQLKNILPKEKIKFALRFGTRGKLTILIFIIMEEKEVKQGTNVQQEQQEVKREENVQNNVVERTQTYSQICERLLKENPNHFLSSNVLLSAHAYKEVTKDKKGFYTKLFLQLSQPLKVFKQREDGTILLTLLGNIQTSVYSLLNAMRREIYFTPIISRTSNDFSSDAEANPDQRDDNNIYITDDYLSGIPVQIFGQYVAEGEVIGNPFSNVEEPYEVKPYPRYIYHVVGISKPTDADTLSNIAEIKKEVRAEIIALRNARKLAKVNATSVINSIDPRTEEIPF